jgi:hypothetical protein
VLGTITIASIDRADSRSVNVADEATRWLAAPHRAMRRGGRDWPRREDSDGSASEVCFRTRHLVSAGLLEPQFGSGKRAKGLDAWAHLAHAVGRNPSKPHLPGVAFHVPKNADRSEILTTHRTTRLSCRCGNARRASLETMSSGVTILLEHTTDDLPAAFASALLHIFGAVRVLRYAMPAQEGIECVSGDGAEKVTCVFRLTRGQRPSQPKPCPGCRLRYVWFARPLAPFALSDPF